MSLDPKEIEKLKEKRRYLLHRAMQADNAEEREDYQKRLREVNKQLDPYITEKEKKLRPKVLSRIKISAFSESALDRELGITSVKKQLNDILKVRKFNDEMENKQIRSIYDMAAKRIKSEINKSGDDAEKIKFLEARLKSLTEQMEYTLNKDDYDPKKFL